jgi:uncharacterized membrane protein (DUF4010 family)
VDPTPILFEKLGISLLLGLLVGLQRQRTANGMPGLRTFPLITVFGTLAGLLAVKLGGWIVAAGLLAMVAILLLPNLVRLKEEKPDPGITTDVAVLLMYAVGAFLVVGPTPVAIAVGGGVAVLLQFKPEMHRFAAQLGDSDLKAVMQFVLITCIVLPVLPNRTYGPLDVFNPFETWLMVVLIVGMSLIGYIAYKFLGRDAGILLGGVLGGIVSSTATAVSYARQTQESPRSAHAAAIVVMIASTVAFGRVLMEIAVVAPEFLATAVPPILVLTLLTLTPSLVLWLRVRREPSQLPEQANPTHLKSAVVFAGMYALVLWALAAAHRYVGGQGVYAVAALSGLTDMDAITLSTARLFKNGDPLIVAEGWRLVVVGALANLVSKGVLVGLLGHGHLLRHVAILFLFPLIGGLLLIFFWSY